MTQSLKYLTTAFTFSTAIAAATIAEAHFVDPVQPEDCKTLITSGEASWYGDEVAKGYDKNRNPIFDDTASGEPFNPDLLTAAYPSKDYLGKYLLVKGLGKEVIVRVNDYGPSRENPNTKDRVIDLAAAAAQRLGMDGVAQVKIYSCDMS